MQVELAEQVPQQRQAEADDRVVVALDARHVGTAEAVDGEGPGDVQRLSGRDVVRDLGVGEVGEVDHRRGGRPEGGGAAAHPVVDEPVTGMQRAAAPAHALPPLDGGLGAVRLAVDLAVQLEDGVAPEHQGVEVVVAADLLRLGPGQGERDIGGVELAVLLLGRVDDGVLVDPGDEHLGMHAGPGQRRVAGRGRGGEDQRDHGAQPSGPGSAVPGRRPCGRSA